MLKLRVITSFVITLLLVSVLAFLPPVEISIFFAVLVLIAAWEWSDLAGLSTLISRVAYILCCIFIMAVMLWYSELYSGQINWARLQHMLTAACIWWGIALLCVKSFPASTVIWGSVFARMVMGMVTLLPAWLALASLCFHQSSIALIAILVALVACADIGAYFTGRRWGRAKLAVRVSPGKSWAGFWGGLACSSLFATILWLIFELNVSLIKVLAVAVLTSLASVLGDLLESMVKRHRGIKDSGVILPGHGGMMDRLDSLSAAAPVFVLCIQLAGW